MRQLGTASGSTSQQPPLGEAPHRSEFGRGFYSGALPIGKVVPWQANNTNTAYHMFCVPVSRAPFGDTCLTKHPFDLRRGTIIDSVIRVVNQSFKLGAPIWADCYRTNNEIGTPAGIRPAGGPISVLSR